MTEHADIPHCDTVTSSPEEGLFWAMVYANEEYQELIDKRKREQALLKDTERWFGRAVFKMHENTADRRILSFVNSMKEHRKNIDEINSEMKKIIDETQTHSSGQSASEKT